MAKHAKHDKTGKPEPAEPLPIEQARRDVAAAKLTGSPKQIGEALKHLSALLAEAAQKN